MADYIADDYDGIAKRMIEIKCEQNAAEYEIILASASASVNVDTLLIDKRRVIVEHRKLTPRNASGE